MANIIIGGSPAFSNFWNFSTSFGSQLAFSTVISRVWPNNDTYFDISAMSSYRNSYFFRYSVAANGPGLIRVISPFDTGFTNSYTTPWFRVATPAFITVTATANYPARFRWWQDGNGTILSYDTTASIAWNTTGTFDIYARFF